MSNSTIKNEIYSKFKNEHNLSNQKINETKKKRFISMNDSMLNNIINNSMDKNNPIKKIKLNNSKNNIYNHNNSNILNNSSNSESKQTKSSNIINETKKLLKNNYSNYSRTSAGKKYNININNEIPIPKNMNKNTTNYLNKNNSNFLNTTNSQKNKDINSYKEDNFLINSNLKNSKEKLSRVNININNNIHEKPQNSSNISNSNSIYSKKQAFITESSTTELKKMELLNNIKISEEISSYKLQNIKLENEIILLNEKIKSLNQVQIFYCNENDILKSKYTDLQEDYKKYLENIKKIKHELNQYKTQTAKLTQNLKSSLNTLLDVVELLLSPRSTNTNKQSIIYNENISYSMDIYDSYNNEEEKRIVIFDQIQSLILSKFNFMKKILNLNFDAEVEKVKNWNNTFNYNKSNNNEINVSNIKLYLKTYESHSFESSKKDIFDLSISNQFLKNNSPKFNNSFGIENENIGDKVIKLNACQKTSDSNVNSNHNIININAFNSNNFSTGNLNLNNINPLNNFSNNEEKLNVNSNFNDYSFLKDMHPANCKKNLI